VDGERPADHVETVGQTAEAGGGPRAADPVVGDLGRQRAAGGPDRDRRARRAGVLGDVRERLGDGEVDRRLDRGCGPGARDPKLDRQRRAGRQPLERRGEPALAQDRGVEAVREVAQLGEPLAELGARLGEQLLRGRAAGPGGGAIEQERGEDEALLGAVVQVALEAAAGLVGGGDDPRARGVEVATARRRVRARAHEDPFAHHASGVTGLHVHRTPRASGM
jgi:hypothetical protein